MFTDTMQRWLEAISDHRAKFNLARLFYPLFDRESSTALNSAGLVISGTTTLAKIGASDFYALATGVTVKVAAATNMAALVGTVVNGTFNTFCFFVDAAGTLTSAMGTAGATLAAMVYPQFPEGKALIGFIIINPTGTGNFVGGTTGLSDGTVVPNTVYINATSGFDPYVLTGIATTP